MFTIIQEKFKNKSPQKCNKKIQVEQMKVWIITVTFSVPFWIIQFFVPFLAGEYDGNESEIGVGIVEQ